MTSQSIADACGVTSAEITRQSALRRLEIAYAGNRWTLYAPPSWSPQTIQARAKAAQFPEPVVQACRMLAGPYQ